MRDNERPLGDGLGVPTGSLAWGKGTLSIVAHAAGFFCDHLCTVCDVAAGPHISIFESGEEGRWNKETFVYKSVFVWRT